MAASCTTSCQSPLVLEKLISKLRSLAGNYGALWQRKTHFWCSKLGFTGAAFCRASRRRRQVSSSSSRCVFDQRGRPRQKVESDIFVCVCLPFLLLHVALLLHNGRSRKDSKAEQQLHAQQRRHQRAEHAQEQWQATKTHPIILCLSAQHNIQKCVRILADVNALSIDHIM